MRVTDPLTSQWRKNDLCFSILEHIKRNHPVRFFSVVFFTISTHELDRAFQTQGLGRGNFCSILCGFSTARHILLAPIAPRHSYLSSQHPSQRPPRTHHGAQFNTQVDTH